MYIREDFVLPVANPSYAQHMKGVVWRDDVDNKRRGREEETERERFSITSGRRARRLARRYCIRFITRPPRPLSLLFSSSSSSSFYHCRVPL